MIERLATIDIEALALSPLDDESLPVARLQAASPREEAAAFLAVAAEVEHALMLQYLYAAGSVRCDQDEPLARHQATTIRRYLLQIAREEMGHLMTVQNLLDLIGAPPHFGRDPELERCGLYPFAFALQPLSSGSLAKYVTAERPNHVAEPERRRKLDDIAAVARQANGGHDVRHIGAIYARLLQLFGDPGHGLQDRDFHVDPGERRARWSDWGYDESLTTAGRTRRVHVDPVDGADAAELRRQALVALHDILEQGEGYTLREDGHCDRLLELYDLVLELERRQIAFTWPVAVNPATVRRDGATYIESTAARAWARLGNLRYRLLLGYLEHFLLVTGERYVRPGQGVDAASVGDYTPRGLLFGWAFDEMRHLAKISTKLTTMPVRAPEDGVLAGPTFELAEGADRDRAGDGHESARWREHARIVALSRSLVQELLDAAGDPARRDPFLEDLQAEDDRTAPVLDALAGGEPIPDGYQPRAFQKVAHILEQAGRGFTVGGHGNFWAGVTRDQFVATNYYGMRFMGFHPEDPARYCSHNAFLTQALARAMPAFRPTIDASRHSFVKAWIDEQAPDGTPPGRVGVHHEREPILDRNLAPAPAPDPDD